MVKTGIKIATIDLYNNERNEGMRCICEIANDAINKNDGNVSTKGIALRSLDSEANTDSIGFPLDEFSQSFATVTVNPNHGRYFGLKLPADDVGIHSITVLTSDHDVPFQFLIFDRKQTSDYYNHADVFWEEKGTGRRLTYIEPRPELYHDRDKCTHLHCGISLDERPMRFDIEGQELVLFPYKLLYTFKLLQF